MRYRRGPLTLYACWLVVAVAGCVAKGGGAAENAPLTVTVLQTGRQCAASGNDWRGTWITSPEVLREWMAACRSNIIVPRQDNVPDVDFSRFGVLAVEMGRRNTAGYGFDAAGVAGYLAGRTAVVAVNCYQPTPGAVTAQVITGPWILIQMPLAGYDGIRVTDQDARPLMEIERP